MLSVTLLASCVGVHGPPRPTAENSAKTPPTYKEALKSKKVRKQNAYRCHPPSIVGKYSWTCLFAPTIGEQWPTWKDCFLRPAAITALVLRLGLLQGGDVGVGGFPEAEEVLVGSAFARGIGQNHSQWGSGCLARLHRTNPAVEAG